MSERRLLQREGFYSELIWCMGDFCNIKGRILQYHFFQLGVMAPKAPRPAIVFLLWQRATGGH